jgi:hypothetical protein
VPGDDAVRPVVDVGQLVAKSEVKVLEILTRGLGEEGAEEDFADELLAWAEGVAISWTWDLKQW